MGMKIESTTSNVHHVQEAKNREKMNLLLEMMVDALALASSESINRLIVEFLDLTWISLLLERKLGDLTSELDLRMCVGWQMPNKNHFLCSFCLRNFREDHLKTAIFGLKIVSYILTVNPDRLTDFRREEKLLTTMQRLKPFRHDPQVRH